MKTKNGYFLISMILGSLIAQSSFGSDGSATSGGGSGTAAEIQRATDEFIRMVEANPAKFPGVDPQFLKSLDPEIRVTGRPIEFCDKSGSLDAVSDPVKGHSTFNFEKWANKSRLEKIHLAGHERLVLAGLERSNRYGLSNQIYELDRKRGEKEIGGVTGVCELGKRACAKSEEIEQAIASIVSGVASGDIRNDPADFLLDGEEDVIETEVLLLVGLKKIEIQRRWANSGDPATELAAYERKVRLAYENRFRPLLLEARRLIEEKSPAPTCVKVSGVRQNLSQGSSVLRSGAVDMNRAVASVMSSQDRNADRGISGKYRKILEVPALTNVPSSASSAAHGAE